MGGGGGGREHALLLRLLPRVQVGNLAGCGALSRAIYVVYGSVQSMAFYPSPVYSL